MREESPNTCTVHVLFRRSTGFIMEGLPYHGDDLRYLCSKGLYPDAAVVFEVLYMYYK